MDDAARLSRLLDRADIVDLKHAYARAADACDPASMVSRFTADCVVKYPDLPPMRGRAAIRDWYAMRIGAVTASSHHITNIEIDFADATTAALRCYLYSWQRFSQYPAVADRHRWARYVDTWVRTDEGWFQSSLTCLLAGELSDDPPPCIGEYLDHDR